MSLALIKTNFHFPGQKGVYHGKVRDVYNIGNNLLIMIVTDRISAFDVVLPKGIPYKGQVLNQIADKFLDATSDIVPNWKIASPDPNVMAGLICDPIKVEMVIRGYLSGHAWRQYKEGKRSLCGIKLPDGMIENQKFPEPIITPTTKADKGHDEDISIDEILKKNLISKEDFELVEDYTKKLFKRGTEIAEEKGLIMVDTKYEFGKRDGIIYLIDEIHTPDSTRYFYADEYDKRPAGGQPQKQLSKEFVRQWLIANGFQGKDNQLIPEMTDTFINSVSDRYIELYESITGDKFKRSNISQISDRIEIAITEFLQ
ncbi:MAG: phosphoribosylaminoimidazolesuccinocarboxamide synthase [Bacteroidales bacterium]|nr:phosphoribosylaminoimidazolesuccinocarboxamide synthase [Bacteroidales bacterium]